MCVRTVPGEGLRSDRAGFPRRCDSGRAEDWCQHEGGATRSIEFRIDPLLAAYLRRGRRPCASYPRHRSPCDAPPTHAADNTEPRDGLRRKSLREIESGNATAVPHQTESPLINHAYANDVDLLAGRLVRASWTRHDHFPAPRINPRPLPPPIPRLRIAYPAR